ncbi:unnamed protein product [Prorocentrum cordatum]|uniref:Uncharacterized protein n=1 Tax=Prorocentrum cordatum TaxID=2364126 RepID=A0ABN9SB68_9DINO|nr:unnamed protein product [Polarella glacialis]
MQNGPDQRLRKSPAFRPKDESSEEAERARLAAVEALRGLQEEDRALGPSTPGRQSATRRGGVQRRPDGPDEGTRKQPTVRPRGESPREAERAPLAAAEALRGLREEGRALEPSGPGGPSAGRGRGVPLLDGLFLVVGEAA